MTPSQAVARFFPFGTGYDRRKAESFLRWIDTCGLELRPKQALQDIDAQDARLVPAQQQRKMVKPTPV